MKPSSGKKKGDPKTEDYYQSVRFEGERWLGHRLSYHLNKDQIPVRPQSRSSGLVLHTCDNKWCVNPDHLYLGTASQNVNDMVERNSDWRENVSSGLKGHKGSWNKGMLGQKHSEDSKKKISEKAKQRYSEMNKVERAKQTQKAREARHG